MNKKSENKININTDPILDILYPILQKLEEDKLRFLNNEIQDIRMEQYKHHHRFTGLVYAVGNVLGLDDKVVDDIVNIDPDVSIEAKSMYRPIDDKDKKEWKEYMDTGIEAEEK